ncbi:MAG: STAS domain-containing protein [Polaromonas sp.]
MSKDDTASGLLSKLVKFVRHPATNWAELDSVDVDKDDSISKQRLKEMMERKRANDFVRKREFDMLRKLRKLEVLAEGAPDQAGRPSFFQSSMASRSDDRASTLKKINEIEAQMSMQWWKTKNQTTSGTPSLLHSRDADTGEPSPEGMLPPAYRPTMPAELDTVAATAAPAPQTLLNDLLPSLPQALLAPDSSDNQGMDSDVQALSPSLFARLMTATQHDVIAHDAELEESAILFANGDDDGAEAGLLEILAPGALRAGHVQTWLALFDLYRATGEQDKFEAAAFQFAERFNRSAPQWYSLPDMVKALVRPSDKPAHGTAADWICSSVLGIQSVGALNAAIARSAMPWRLDWSNLKTIEAGALEPLYKVFRAWATQPVQLRFMGDAQLQKVLLNATPSGERSTDQKWWLLRMELLRILHRPDDFELTALDFCVTYEVSPPAWDCARCDYKSLDQQGDAMGRTTIIGARSSEPVYPKLLELDADSALDFPSTSPPLRFLSVEISGQIQGHAADVLDRLEASFMGADRMQISCAKLIRVDFSAAGMLLNWLSARQAENRSVEFSEVNRLIATFFNVIGITEYARVVVRND